MEWPENIKRTNVSLLQIKEIEEMIKGKKKKNWDLNQKFFSPVVKIVKGFGDIDIVH